MWVLQEAMTISSFNVVLASRLPAFLRTVSLALLLIGIAGCSSSPVGKETQRETSPDKLVDAVLVSRETGATVATATELYLVPTGQDWNGETPILRGDKFEGAHVRWRGARFLEIRYAKGRIFSFTNFWNSANLQTFKYVVEVRLMPESEATITE